MVVLRPQAMGHFVRGFESIPIHAGNADGLIAGIIDLISRSMPIIDGLCGGKRGN
jgi:hypothetical protein